MSKKILVIYYSLSGNAKWAADCLQEKLGADIVELKVAKESGKDGFMKYFWGGRQVVMKEKPDLLNDEIKFEDYDVLILGTPMWAWSDAPAWASFFDKDEVKNKKIALYCCCGGDKGKSFEGMKEKLVGNDFIGELELVEPLHSIEDNRRKLLEWVDQLMLDIK